MSRVISRKEIYVQHDQKLYKFTEIIEEIISSADEPIIDLTEDETADTPIIDLTTDENPSTPTIDENAETRIGNQISTINSTWPDSSPEYISYEDVQYTPYYQQVSPTFSSNEAGQDVDTSK